MYKELNELAEECGTRAADKGWHDRFDAMDPELDHAERIEHVITKMALISCEVAEAIEEIRSGRFFDETYYSEGHKPEGVPSELADVIIRTLDLAYMLGIDLGAIVQEKLDFNGTRPYKHGKRV